MTKHQFTASDMVRAFCSEGAGTQEELREVIKYYSDEGIIPVVGLLNSGRGKPRLYDEDGALIAATVVRLNKVGIPIGQLKRIIADLKLSVGKRHGLYSAARAVAFGASGGDKSMENLALVVLIPPFDDEETRSAIFLNLTDSSKALDALEVSEDMIFIKLGKYLDSLTP